MHERWYAIMSKSITYGQLEDALLTLGYTREEIPGSHRLFTTGDPAAMVMLPIMPRNRPAHQLHVMGVRSTLHWSGVLDQNDFEAFVERGERAAS